MKTSVKTEAQKEAHRAAGRRWYARNRDHERARTLKWHKAHPESGRRSAAKRRSLHHGLTRLQVLELLAAQGGRCAICGTTSSGGTGWQGDHDHHTGRFRGVLCRGCNQGIGQLKENADALRAAAAYIEKHKAFGELL